MCVCVCACSSLQINNAPFQEWVHQALKKSDRTGKPFPFVSFEQGPDCVCCHAGEQGVWRAADRFSSN